MASGLAVLPSFSALSHGTAILAVDSSSRWYLINNPLDEVIKTLQQMLNSRSPAGNVLNVLQAVEKMTRLVGDRRIAESEVAFPDLGDVL